MPLWNAHGGPGGFIGAGPHSMHMRQRHNMGCVVHMMERQASQKALELVHLHVRLAQDGLQRPRRDLAVHGNDDHCGRGAMP